MFGFSLKSKAKKVLWKHFEYVVHPHHKQFFNQCVQLNKLGKNGGNEYSLAMLYMLGMLRSLLHNWTLFREEDRTIARANQNVDFLLKTRSILYKINHLSPMDDEELDDAYNQIHSHYYAALTLYLDKQGRDKMEKYMPYL